VELTRLLARTATARWLSVSWPARADMGGSARAIARSSSTASTRLAKSHEASGSGIPCSCMKSRKSDVAKRSPFDGPGAPAPPRRPRRKNSTRKPSLFSGWTRLPLHETQLHEGLAQVQFLVAPGDPA